MVPINGISGFHQGIPWFIRNPVAKITSLKITEIIEIHFVWDSAFKIKYANKFLFKQLIIPPKLKNTKMKSFFVLLRSLGTGAILSEVKY